jgi:hypothetical protein
MPAGLLPPRGAARARGGAGLGSICDLVWRSLGLGRLSFHIFS